MSSILFLATEWGASKGGVNAFNQDLSSNCGLLAKGKYRVCCCVLEATEIDIQSALESGVRLISLHNELGINRFTEETIPHIAKFFGTPENKCSFVVGHDIFTGPVAIAVAKAIGTKSVLFIHADYNRYKAIQDGGNAKNAHEKAAEQVKLIRNADRVFGVGPLLTEAARALDGSVAKKRRDRIKQFVPGLPDIKEHHLEPGMTAFSFGRFDDERIEIIKQSHLCIAGYCDFAAKTSIPRQIVKRLLIVGLARDPATQAQQIARIIELAKQYYNSPIVFFREFMPRAEAWEQLRMSHIAMMLSLHEGFGLVGWEALAAGVPLILSDTSGLFEHLAKNHKNLAALCWPVEVNGGYSGLNDRDVFSVSDVLRRISADCGGARWNARFVRKELRRMYPWKRQAARFFKALDPKGFRFGPAEHERPAA